MELYGVLVRMHDTMVATPDFSGLSQAATGRMAHFTAAQASEVGISRMLLQHHINTGRIIRVYPGV